MLFSCNRDSLCASFLQMYKTPFSFSSRNHTTGCYLHQFLPLQKFLNEISICCLLLSQYPTRIFSCVHTELLSFHFILLLLSSKRGCSKHKQFPPLQAQGRTSRVQQNSGNYVIGRLSLKFSLFCCVLVFFVHVCFKNVSFSKYELVNRAMAGRSRSTAIVRGSLFF